MCHNCGIAHARLVLCAGLRNICPVTGKPLAGWVSVLADDALRNEIEAWARSQQLDFEALTAAKYKAPASTCRCGLVAPACACSSPVRAALQLAAVALAFGQTLQRATRRAIPAGSGG